VVEHALTVAAPIQLTYVQALALRAAQAQYTAASAQLARVCEELGVDPRRPWHLDEAGVLRELVQQQELVASLGDSPELQQTVAELFRRGGQEEQA
jgi:hypothetical protein